MRAEFRAAACVGLFWLFCFVPLPALADPAIDWRLENPFRLFKNPAHTAMHVKAFEALSPEERRNAPVLAAERVFAQQTGGRGWAEQMFADTCYDQDANKYSACKDYILPKSHRVVFWFTDGPKDNAQNKPQDRPEPIGRDLLDDIAPRPGAADHGLSKQGMTSALCVWSVHGADGRAAIDTAKAPCAEPVTLEIPYPRGARVSVATETGGTGSIEVKVRDVLVMAMGDSFGAGEGNPDYAEKFNDERTVSYGKVELAENDEHLQLDGYPAREGDWKDINDSNFDRHRARWWDRECHRSLYSHQVRAALQLAVENPKRAITFVSYSCSGSEVGQGILLRKPVRECSPGQSATVPGQMSTASEELCNQVDRDLLMPQSVINRMPELIKLDEDDMRVSRCSKKPVGDVSLPRLKRPVDLVLLSIGGNDVGFVSVLSDAMLSDRSVYRILGKPMGAVYGVDTARKQLKILQQRLEALRFDLSLSLGMPYQGASQRNVVLTGYPHMGFRQDGHTACAGREGMEVFPPFRLNGEKVLRAEEFADELNQALTGASAYGWRVVTGFDAEFRKHGLCAMGDGAPDDENLELPLKKDGQWRPFPPSAYRPYASRQRWFRTPNDSFMASNLHARQVANFGVQCSMAFSSMLSLAKKHWTPFQLFLASTYGGAFHPTAEGQARLADDVVKEAREVIDGH